MKKRVRLTRTVRVVDEMRVERSRRVPDLGPRILFFSGGTALRGLCRRLKLHTEGSCHIITPFDSGGSSALLRETFGMPSVGDLRNRLMALADETARGSPEIYRLFSYRFAAEGKSSPLKEELLAMVQGEHELVAAVPGPMRRLIRTHLRMFIEHAPSDFDLRRASIGNLILAGGYLHNERDMDSVLFLFSQLVGVRGTVALSTSDNLHIAAELADGSEVLGQHLLTGKEHPPIASPVVNVRLVTSLQEPKPAPAQANRYALRLIEGAELICFPMGSFYSSVIANLLPTGVGSAIARAGAPKVYIPNTASDPEQLGLGVADCVERIIDAVRRDSGEQARISDIVDLVILDESDDVYTAPPEVGRLRQQGIEVLRVPLVTRESHPRIDPQRLTEVLLSLV